MGPSPATFEAEVEQILARLREGKRVRRSVGAIGRISLDRPLPFLCVYRAPPRRADAGTGRLVTAASAHLIATGDPRDRQRLGTFVRQLASELSEAFGALLVVEIWSATRTTRRAGSGGNTFRIVVPRAQGPVAWLEELETALLRLESPLHESLSVSVVRARDVGPPGLSPLLSAERAARIRCTLIGLEVPAIYRDDRSGKVFPVVHRWLRGRLAAALNRAAYQFTRAHTTHRPVHYHALGRRSFTKTARQVDRALADVAGAFDFLLLTTPRNAEEAWDAFRRSRFEHAPAFSYRPRPFDVPLIKRRLYAIPIERIEDPTLSDLLRQQQDEIDRKLTMIADRETPRFRHEGAQLFGGVDDALLAEAVTLLERIPSRARETGSRGTLDASAFAARAEEEIAALRRQHEGVTARVQVRDDVAGLLVSSGSLLVGRTNRIPVARVEALIQHEVGTHLVTYYNGAAQPFQQLRGGLAGYEELQEALAVLAEYLVGGLSRPRMRLLAARVLAVRRMLDGADFIEVFRELDRGWDLSQRVAFTTTMRVFRGGGHAKDAVYLRGLRQLLGHLKAGHPLEPLYVGKIGLPHLPMVEELAFRGVLRPVPLLPRFLGRADVQQRLRRLRGRVSLLDLSGEEGRERAR